MSLAKALCKRGAWLRYACAPGGFAESLCAKRGVPAEPLIVKNSGDFRAASQLAHTILRFEIDIVHVHSRRDYLPATLAALWARRIGRMASPSIVLHAHLIRPLGAPRRLSNWFFGKTADQVLAVSTAVREEIQGRHHVPDDFARVLPNGIDTALFAAPDDPRWAGWRAEQRAAWGIREREVVVGMVGRLDAKGQATLLSVARDLLSLEPNLRFVFVGSQRDSQQPGHLQAIAESSGIADRTVYTGETERVPEALAAFDILAHLPTDESFGLAITEAMAAGLPAVVTDIGGCRDVVEDGVTGLLTPVSDAAALISALSQLLEPSFGPTRRRLMGDAGRNRVQRYFSLDVQVEILERLYHQLFSR